MCLHVKNKIKSKYIMALDFQSFGFKRLWLSFIWWLKAHQDPVSSLLFFHQFPDHFPLQKNNTHKEQPHKICWISFFYIIHILYFCYLPADVFEFMTHSKYFLAAKLSKTLLTSLVKLPSTCLLRDRSAPLLPVTLGTRNIFYKHKILNIIDILHQFAKKVFS